MRQVVPPTLVVPLVNAKDIFIVLFVTGVELIEIEYIEKDIIVENTYGGVCCIAAVFY
jgi:hypothetical protein